MQVSLAVVGGKHHGRTIPIEVAEFTIGRDDKCNLKPSSPEISRKHCAVVVRDNQVFVRDYGSKNGTRVNKRLLHGGEFQLETGDELAIGPLAFRVEIAAQVPAAGADSGRLPDFEDLLIDDSGEIRGGQAISPDDTALNTKATDLVGKKEPAPAKPTDSQVMLCSE